MRYNSFCREIDGKTIITTIVILHVYEKSQTCSKVKYVQNQVLILFAITVIYQKDPHQCQNIKTASDHSTILNYHLHMHERMYPQTKCCITTVQGIKLPMRVSGG